MPRQKMAKFGGKTYTRRELKTNLQFDQLLSDNKNKPSTAKVSVASVHRWGMASFTSIRKTQLEKQKHHHSDTNTAPNKRKKYEAKVKPPDRVIPEFNDDPFSFESDLSTSKPERVKTGSVAPVQVPMTPPSVKSPNSRPNKFFKSREVKPLAAQNSPVIEPAPAEDVGFKPPSDNRRSRKKQEVSKPEQIRSDNVSETHFSEPKASSNFDMMFMQNPLDALDDPSSEHSIDSPLPDYFDMQEDPSEQTEETFLPKTAVEKHYSPPDYSSKFDSLFPPEKDSASEGSNRLSLSPPTFHSSAAPQTRTYTRSRRKAEENALNLTENAIPQRPGRATTTVFHVLPPLHSLSENTPSTSDTANSSMTASSDIVPPICLVPKSWSESVGLVDSQTSESAVYLSQESKGTLSAPSLSESQQSGENDSLEDGHNRGSVFKSKRIFNSPKLKKATYKHRPWQVEESDETENSSQETDKVSLAEELVEDQVRQGIVFDGHKLTLSKQVKQSRHPGEKITSWTCQRKVKELYTVVHNVKQAYQCHESGETQEFNDDVEYLLEGIQQTSSLGTRCLSTLGWASKCMVPSFRIHVRAHGTMSSVYSALVDAPKEPSLSLCVATLMFVLSQDRLTMDLEARSLSLMLQLLDTTEVLSETAANLSVSSLGGSQSELPDSQVSVASSFNDSISLQQNSKVMEKVRHLCEVMKQNGYAKQLDLNNITTGNLAMETLLSMTSRKAGEWFKEEIRTLGGLDYIIDTVNMCVEQFGDCAVVLENPAEEDLDILRKVDRCLRVIENVTYLNTGNQDYLLEYKNSSLLKICVSLLQMCRNSIFHNPLSGSLATGLSGTSTSIALLYRNKDGPGTVFFACIMVLLRVLVNLTNENSRGSKYFQEGLMDTVLLCILQTPQSVPPDERFDLLVLALGVLINLMDVCEENRHRFVALRTLGSYDCRNSGCELSAIEALVELFLNRCDLARQSEEHTDALLDGQVAGKSPALEQGGSASSSQTVSSQQSKADEMEETLVKALQKAGKNMEHTMIAAYIALLLGCIIQSNEYADLVRIHLPNQNFQCMVDVLRKFLNFINLTGNISTTGLKSIQRVLGILESS